MFILELKKSLKKKSVYIALICGILICLIRLYMEKDNLLFYKNTYLINPINIYDKFILIDIGLVSQLFIILVPLLATFGFADNYKEDLDSGILRTVYSRTSRNNYLISKFLINYIISFFIIFIPLLIDILILKLFLPAIKYNAIFSHDYVNFSDMLLDLQKNNYAILIMILIILISALGASFSSIALSISTFIKNRYVVCLIPIISSILLTIVGEIIPSINKYIPFQLFTTNNCNIIFQLLSILIITIVSFIMYYILGKKYEGV